MSQQDDAAPSAENVFANWMGRLEAGSPEGFEDLLEAHPRLASELRSLREDWVAFEPILQRVALGVVGLANGPDVATLSTSAPRSHDAPPEDLLGRLGVRMPEGARYRFRSVLGRGGFGVVLKVWDQKLNRPVAMKIVRGRGEGLGADRAPRVDSQSLARFIDEARIASQLNHPGIVPVHELGVDDAGCAFFTMKLVKGENLASVFAHVRTGADGWSLTRSLSVLQRVCEAMAYAHDHGVVHRDLKPANVMVGPYGEVHVMDWGLARVLGSPSTPASALHDVASVRGAERDADPDSPLLTGHGSVLGTPSYMPPEQARGELELVGPRSDVYAVGAMLRHLLTGAAPYAERGTSVPPRAVLLAVIQGPPAPLELLAPEAPAELAAICDRAMARDPSQRYSSMKALAADLAAYLEGRVVSAHDSGVWAQARKWVRRNRAFAAALAAVLVAVVSGVGFSLTYAADARTASEHADERAEQARVSAELASAREAQAIASAQRARRVTEFVQATLGTSDPFQKGSKSFLVSDAMDIAIAKLEQGELSNEPLVASELRLIIAAVLYNTSRFDEAAQLAATAVETLRAQGDTQYVTLPRALAALGRYETALGRPAQALTWLREARELAGSTSDSSAEDLVDIDYALGEAARHLGHADQALAHFEDGVRRLNESGSSDDRRLASGLNAKATALTVLARFEEAVATSREALDIRRRLAPEGDVALVMSLNDLGDCLRWAGEPFEAVQVQTEALELVRRIYKSDDQALVVVEGQLGGSLLAIGRADEALAHQQSALAIAERLHPADHPSVVQALNNVAECLQALGDTPQALAYFDAALRSRRGLLGPEHPETAKSENNYGNCLLAMGLAQDALPYLQTSLAALRRTYSQDHHLVAIALNNVARSLVSCGLFELGLEHLTQALEMRWRLQPLGSPWVAESLNSLGLTQHRMGRFAQAAQTLTEACTVRARTMGERHPQRAYSLANLARTLARLGCDDQAREAALEAEQIARASMPEGHAERRAILDNTRATLDALDARGAAR